MASNYYITAKNLPTWHALYSNTDTRVDLSEVLLSKTTLTADNYPTDYYNDTSESSITDFDDYFRYTSTNYKWMKHLPADLFTYTNASTTATPLIKGTCPHLASSISKQYTLSTAGKYKLKYVLGDSHAPGTPHLDVYNSAGSLIASNGTCPYCVVFGLVGGGAGGGGGKNMLIGGEGGGGGGGGGQIWGVIDFTQYIGKEIEVTIGAAGSGGSAAGVGSSVGGTGGGGGDSWLHGARASGGSGGLGGDNGMTGGSGGGTSYSTTDTVIRVITTYSGRKGGDGCGKDKTGAKGAPTSATNISLNLGNTFTLANSMGTNGGANGRGGGGGGMTSSAYGHGGNGGAGGSSYTAGNSGTAGALVLYW